ncbi:MAG: MBOAT family O-acyltransferase [Caldilineaceae bacterium]
MLFNSSTFFIFFALVLSLYQLPFSWRVKKVNLLWASYLFYAVWNPPFVLLLIFSTVVDWVIAKRLDCAHTTWARRGLLVTSLVVNLGLLGYFKYSNFVLANLQALLALVGIAYQPVALNIVLPVGISFYTFQTLSYTLDIYLRKDKPWDSFLDYALYVTFFPQLVAGPIVRATDFLPQCRKAPRVTAAQLGYGFSLFTLGLFQKVVLADGLLSGVVEKVYDGGGLPGFVAAWCGTLAFAGQIYYDFSGYSNCAIGVALCLGFWLPTNFRFPYAAMGFSDFWNRWHISLSSWLRDYLYIPLGGNRNGQIRTLVNLMVTMLIGGLWHGASWTFIVWGGLHGLYLIVERLLRKVSYFPALWNHAAVKLGLGLLTFALVCITWVFFRAGALSQALTITATLLGLGGTSPGFMLAGFDVVKSLGAITLIVLFDIVMRNHSLEALFHARPWLVRAAMLAAMVVAIVMMPGEDRAFIYFQF